MSPNVLWLAARAPAELLAELQGLGAQVERAEQLDQPSPKTDLVIADYDALTATQRERLARHFEGLERATQLLVISAGECRRDFPSLFGRHVLTNLLAASNGKVDAADFAATVRKLLGINLTGLAPYLGPEYRRLQLKVRSSEVRQELISAAAAFAAATGVPKRLQQVFADVVDELLTNALYDAPVDQHGVARCPDRAKTVELSPSESIDFELGASRSRLGVMVRDPFGTLRAGRVLDYLAKCFERGDNQVDNKVGGAGLGLYYSFELLSHLTFRLEAGRSTEAIGLLECTATFREHVSRAKSFNLFAVS